MEIPGTSNDLATSSQNCDDYSGSSLTTQQSIGLDGLANSHVSIVDVDPKYIVNEYCSRPVLPSDKETVRRGFLKTGYVSSILLSCRYATAPEIESFYMRAPYNYSQDKAAEVTRAHMRSGFSRDHFYCYDGHIRKFVALDLIHEGLLQKGFKFKSLLKEHLSAEVEIAYSLSLNVVQEHSVPLSFMGLLLRCFDYDTAVNRGRPKPLSATEVGKRMADISGSANDKLKSKMAQTRRQIIGLVRKMPLCVVEFLRELASRDTDHVQDAFNLANFRAIKGSLTDEQFLSVVKRMANLYQNSLPLPKAVQPSAVSVQIVKADMALNEIEKFKSLCGYSEIPSELQPLVENMVGTQIFDNALDENANKRDIFPALEEACRNTVPGSTVKLAAARRALDSAGNTLSPAPNPSSSDVPSGDPGGGAGENVHPEKETEAGFHGEQSASISSPVTLAVDEEGEVVDKPELSKDPGLSDTQDTVDQNVGSEEPDAEDVESVARQLLPQGWMLLKTHFQDVSKQTEYWKQIQGKADLVLMTFPDEDTFCEEKIRDAVRHCGIAMKLSGVSHIFCTHLQWRKVYEFVRAEGMECMQYPKYYIEDASSTKKRTLTQRPQNNCQVAAVFFRDPSPGTKHHYSSRHPYPPSTTPAWTSVVTNVRKCDEKVIGRDGVVYPLQDWDKDFMVSILNQWCQPAGFCYEAVAGTMSAAVACHQLGLKYVGVEDEDEKFNAGAMRILDHVQETVRKRPRISAPDAVRQTRSKSRQQDASNAGDSSEDTLTKDIS